MVYSPELPPPDDGWSELPPSALPMVPPEGNSAEIAALGRHLIRQAHDVAHIGQRTFAAKQNVEVNWASGDGRDNAINVLSGLGSDMELHAAGLLISGQACKTYSHDLAEIERDFRHLQNRAGNYDGRRAALHTKLAAAAHPHKHADEIDALRTEHDSIVQAHQRILQRAKTAEQAAAAAFLQASVMSVRRLQEVGGRVKPGMPPSEISKILFSGSVATTGTSLLTDEERAQFTSIMEREFGTVAEQAGKGLLRGILPKILLRGTPWAIGVGTFVELMKPQPVADGTITGQYSDGQKQEEAARRLLNLVDKDGNDRIDESDTPEAEPSTDGAGAKVPPGCGPSGPVGNGDLAISLKYNPNWSPEQRDAADQKVAALDKAAKNGDLEVVKTQRSQTHARSRFQRSGGQIPEGADVDHTIDLQLGGADDVKNMSPLDKSVNRSLGPQIMHQLRGARPGTRVTEVSIC